jgi:hypothetical protein
MRITRDVVADLLPLYLSGEASADTRQLVDEYLLNDPALAQEVREPLVLTAAPPALTPDLELRALLRARRLLGLRGLLVGTGIFFTLLPFSFVAGHGRVTWLWSGAPRLAAVFAVVATFTWTGYWLLRRRLRSTGL